MAVYLLHFDRPYQHAKHYIGYAKNVKARVESHRNGTSGARLMSVIREAGIGFVVAKTWAKGTKKFERQLKNRGGASRICPICRKAKKQERLHNDRSGG